MNGAQAYDYIRKLAKTDYWQTCFSLGEKIKIKLFNNENDFNKLQLLFIKYLNFYSNIYMDISMGEITDLVLENEIYEDSYVYYKNKKDKEKYKNQEVNINKSRGNISGEKWIFKKLPKK